MSRQTYMIVGVVVSVLVVSFLGYMLIGDMGMDSDTTGIQSNVWHHGCEASGSSKDLPALVQIETKLGVTYNAGHWFHMSEVVMTQHSPLLQRKELVNSSIVYVNFDKDGFIADLNGITRLIVYLGIVAENAHVKEVRFISSQALAQASHHDHLQREHNLAIDFSKIDPKNFESIYLHPDQVPTTARFTTPMIKRAAVDASRIHGQTECVRVVHNLKARWPTPQRGSWFPRPEDMPAFRAKLRDACPRDPVLVEQYAKKTSFKLVIYQRNLSRKLANEAEAVTMLQQALEEATPGYSWSIVVVMHETKRSPCVLAHMLSDCDVLLTPHGFQSMLLLFLPRPSLLFEVFPYRYWKRGYGPLSKEYGVLHDGVMSPATQRDTSFFLSYITTATCMQNKFCRGFAREQDVRLTGRGLRRLVQAVTNDLLPALHLDPYRRPSLPSALPAFNQTIAPHPHSLTHQLLKEPHPNHRSGQSGLWTARTTSTRSSSQSSPSLDAMASRGETDSNHSSPDSHMHVSKGQHGRSSDHRGYNGVDTRYFIVSETGALLPRHRDQLY